MRKLALAGIAAAAAALVMGGSVTGAAAADALTLQLKWVTQAQFAGYYVASRQGLLQGSRAGRDDQAGRAGHQPVSQVIAGGGADVVVDWMPSALATREKGVPLVNIAQTFNKSGHDADLPQG